MSLVVVLVLSMLLTRVATIALTLTGMTRESARFQARSALTGAGFTTSESEKVVNHPIRRRVVMWLMLIGNGGLVIVAALLILILGGGGEQVGIWSYVGLAAGLVGLWFLATSQWIDRRMSQLIERLLQRHTDLDTRDFMALLRLHGEYTISELAVEENDWLAGRQLDELGLSREGVLVLGISRADGTFLGAPRGDSLLNAGNVPLLYGRDIAIKALDQREAGATGNLAHLEAVVEQQQQAKKEKAEDTEAEPTNAAAEFGVDSNEHGAKHEDAVSQDVAPGNDPMDEPTRHER